MLHFSAHPLFRRVAFALFLLAGATVCMPFVGLGAEQGAGPAGPEVVLRGEDGAAWLTLHPTGALLFDGGALRGELELRPTSLDTPWLVGLAHGKAEARVEADRVVLEAFSIRMDGARLLPLELEEVIETNGTKADKIEAVQTGTEPGAVVDLRLSGSGVWWPGDGRLKLDKVRLEMGPSQQLAGSLSWSESDGLDADFALDATDGGRVATLLASLFPRTLKGLVIRDPLRLNLRFATGSQEVAAGEAEQVVAGSVMRFGLDVRQPLSVTMDGTALTLPRLQAGMTLQPGSGGQWDASGKIDVRGMLAPGGKDGVSLSSPVFTFDVGMSAGVYRLRQLRISSADGVTLAGSKLPVRSVGLSGDIAPLPDQGWRIAPLRLELPGGVVDGNATVAGDGSIQGAFRAPGLQLAVIGPLLARLAGVAGTDADGAPAWTAEGRLDISGDLQMTAEQITSDVRLRLRDLGYISPDSLQMGQGLGGTMRLRSRLSTTTLRRWVNADVRLDKGEALFGATYLNISEYPLRFTANANQLGTDRFKDLKAELDWKGFGALKAEGDLWANGSPLDWRYRGKAEARDMDIGAVFTAFVSAPFGLNRWQGPEAGLGGKGDLSVSLYADGSKADMEGRLTIRDASLRSAEGDVDVRGAYLDLPLAYRIKGPTQPPAAVNIQEEQLGTLRIARLRSPWSERENLAVRMALVPNRFYLLDPIRIPLFGGRIRLEDLRCDEPLSKEFELSLNAAFKEIDLAQWSREGVPLMGVLHGDLGRITATRKMVTIPGAVEGDFFGGAVRADRFFMAWPLEARRQFGGDASVRGLDMERLSSALGIGRVTGLLDLDLKQLLFAFGQPAQFQLSAKTSGEGDFEKSVSLRAVNSLSVIGTGSGIGDVGVGLFASFFEEFSYASIGFQCTLNNDRFQVRGLVREGGVEYLIKKPFLTGINVVNGNPENYISFSDMLERIQRVVKGSATSAPSSGMP